MCRFSPGKSSCRFVIPAFLRKKLNEEKLITIPAIIHHPKKRLRLSGVPKSADDDFERSQVNIVTFTQLA